MARCEALLAVMMISDGIGIGADRDAAIMLRDLIRHGYPDFPEDEWLYVLDHTLRRAVERRPEQSELRERLNLVERRSTETETRVGELREMFDKTMSDTQELRDSVSVQLRRVSALPAIERQMSSGIEDLTQAQRSLQSDVHSYLAAQSLGLDLDAILLRRFVPVRVYLSEASSADVERVTRAVEESSSVFGFAIADDFPAESGSWYKKLFIKTKEVATQPEVKDRIDKLERALQLKGLHEPQSQIDKNEAEAAATLIKAIEKIPNAAIQTGSLLLVKLSNPDGDDCLQVRTLSQREMIQLEKNQHLLTHPATVLHELSRISTADEEVAALTDSTHEE